MQRSLGLASIAACVMAASAAQALPVSGEITIGGYAAAIGAVGMAAATGIDFVSGAGASRSVGTAGGITSFGGGTGTFAGFGCASAGGSCGSIQDLRNFNSGPITSFLTLYNGGTTVSFDLASVSVLSRDFGSNTIKLSATGTINETGYSASAGNFELTATGDSITSFSATATATVGTVFSDYSVSSLAAATFATAIPEPGSLLVLGGSLMAAGWMRRKKA